MKKQGRPIWGHAWWVYSILRSLGWHRFLCLIGSHEFGAQMFDPWAVWQKCPRHPTHKMPTFFCRHCGTAKGKTETCDGGYCFDA